MRKPTWIWLSLLGCLAIATPAAAQASGRVTTAAQATLGERMHAFLRAVERERPEALVAFFPTAADLTWVQTLHTDDDTRVSVWRFPPSDLRRALGYDGPLRPSFQILVESQPIGLFRHQTRSRQAFARRKGWRLVHGNRFVPAGEAETAALFVEWRREAGAWVVSAFGDERFRLRDNRRLPHWCC
jgi:hypothetical protein